MALMAVCSEMSPGLQVPHYCDTGQCARPLNQNSPDTGTTLHCTGYLSYSLSSRSTEKVPGIPCRDFRSEQGFKILFVPNPVGTQHQKLYFHFVPAAPAPAAAVVATVWIRMWRGIDLWSWLTFIMVLPMLAVIKRYFLMMSANFRQPPTKCLVANTLYIYLHIYQEFKSHF